MLDPGFTPLDNSANERPDWREYWPIRRFLLSQRWQRDCLYGFLAPRFREKTGLSAEDVRRRLSAAPADCDVCVLSGYDDQGAEYLNVFEQGNRNQPGLTETATKLLLGIGLSDRPGDTVNTVQDSIFCNYFAAGADFWREWLTLNEKLFAIAEHHRGALGDRLNVQLPYRDAQVAMKVFIMERTASYLLATQPRWRTAPKQPFELPLGTELNRPFLRELAGLDAEKAAFRRTGDKRHLESFHALRRRYRQL